MSAGRRNWRFHFVDVFAVEPLTGNSLAVVEDAADLTVEQLQRIAREFNQSETTFLLPPTRPDADWRLRSFTAAGAEVFGAGGHNSLGAWWWLAYLRQVVLGQPLPPRKAIRPIPEVNRQTYVELGRVGANLNQLVKLIHAGAHPHRSEFLAILELVAETVGETRRTVLGIPESSSEVKGE